VSISRRRFLALAGSIFGGVALGGSRLFGAQGRPVIVEMPGALASELGSGLAGRVADILSGNPVSSATVSAVESGSKAVVATTSTSAGGEYSLAVGPGTYEVRVGADGYVGMSRVRQRVVSGSVTRVDFRMIPLVVSPQDEQRLYDAVVTVPESPLDILGVEQGQPPPAAASLGVAVTSTLSNKLYLPYVVNSFVSAVTVPDTIVVKFPDGTTETMALDEYLKGVVPSEMPASWPAEALKAQAVAARSYAVAYYLARGYVCTTTACQVYNPDKRYSTTDQAVDATHNQVGVYDGKIISANFFAMCNAESTRNSEDALTSYDNWKTCQSAPWSYVPYLRAQSCGGHSRYTSTCGYWGHGVGMCQYGAQARASLDGWDYRQIIGHYYYPATVEVGTSAG